MKVSKVALVLFGLLGSAASIYGIAYTFNDDAPDVRAGDSTQISTGNNSPNIVAGRDVTVLSTRQAQFEHVSEHNGAGAPVLTEPSMKAYVAAAVKKTEQLQGRLINGTGVKVLERRDQDVNGVSANFVKIEVLEGDLKGTVGWTPSNFIRKAN